MPLCDAIRGGTCPALTNAFHLPHATLPHEVIAACGVHPSPGRGAVFTFPSPRTRHAGVRSSFPLSSQERYRGAVVATPLLAGEGPG